MYRSERLVIRLNKIEHATINRLAQVERLPLSTLARRLLLQEADRRGLSQARTWKGQAGEVSSDGN